jgi:hypothetical protein
MPCQAESLQLGKARDITDFLVIKSSVGRKATFAFESVAHVDYHIV